MAQLEFIPQYLVKFCLPLSSCLAIGVWLLVQTGCARAPEPVALELDIEEDTTVEITLTTTQTATTDTTYHISALPQHGSVSGTPPKIRYKPTTNYFGTDELEYVAQRGNGRASKPATVNIVITAVNDPPVAEPIRITTAMNTAVMIQAQAIDVDGRVAKYEIATSPSNGEVELDGEMFRYTPRLSFLGDDSFEYVAIDESGLRSANAQVTVRTSLQPQEEERVPPLTEVREPEGAGAVPTETVTTQTPDTITTTNTAGNSHPVAKNLEVVLLEDSDVQLEFEATDSDGTVERYGISTLPAHGTLSRIGAKTVYTPSTDFYGTDSFAYVAIDDQGGVSTPAVVSITVDPVNDIPTAESSNWATVEDSSGIYLDLRANDPDGTVATFTIVQAPTNGTVNDVGGGRWLYVPYEDFSGFDSFQWVATDDDGDRSIEATVTLQVQEQPDPPTVRLRNSLFETTVGERININVIVIDPDNDANRFAIREGRRANGKFHPNRGTIDELAYLRFEATKRGISTYAVEVHDRSGLSAYATFTIEVTNIPPVVQLPIPSYDRTSGTANFSLRVQDPDGTIDHFVIQTIDNRRASSIKVNGSIVTDARSFTTGGACETEDSAWCTLNVVYKPDVIDGHSRRIRVYAVDDEGVSSPKDFIRIETNQLKVAYQIADEEDDDVEWFPPSPRIPPYKPPDPPVVPPPDDNEEPQTEVLTPVVVVPEENTPERDSDEVILERIDAEEIKQVTDPNREVPRNRR